MEVFNFQASTSCAKNPFVKEWDLSNPYLWATTFDVGNKHNALRTYFVQKYTFNTKAGKVLYYLLTINWNLSKMQHDAG